MTTPLRLTKRERIKLLLKTRPDALGETAAEGGRGQFGSRSLQHGDLWHAGSYRDLERLLDEMRSRCPRIHWHTVRFYVSSKGWQPGLKPRHGPAELGLSWLEARMTNVYVPQAVSENAGYLSGEAARYVKPKPLQPAA